MKGVLDTNVFISGIFWEGNFCSQLINKWKNGDFQLISSPLIIEELVETLRSFKIPMPEELRG
jgi:predicted nucleic acid-binding protein